jgi:hypothetical protein
MKLQKQREGAKMAKTMEQRKAEFTALMEQNGFTPNGETLYDGRTVYSRIWEKEVDVFGYGKCVKRLEIKVDEAYGIPAIRIFRGRKQDDRRDYSTPKRAVNAMREIVTFAGYEF